MTDWRRESILQFWARVDKEGRRAQAQAARDQLLAAGRSKRHTQALLVQCFQPLDGNKTRAWTTPDSWACGRQDARKPPPDQQELFEQDVLWVHANQDEPLEKAPTPGARLLLQTAQKRPDEFLRIYVKCLPGIVQRTAEKRSVRRQKVAVRRDAKGRRAAADKRAAYRDAQAQRQAAEQEDARRRAGAKKSEPERLQQQLMQASPSKSSADGQQHIRAIHEGGGEDRVVI
jgi:hypothetical protein